MNELYQLNVNVYVNLIRLFSGVHRESSKLAHSKKPYCPHNRKAWTFCIKSILKAISVNLFSFVHWDTRYRPLHSHFPLHYECKHALNCHNKTQLSTCRPTTHGKTKTIWKPITGKKKKKVRPDKNRNATSWVSNNNSLIVCHNFELSNNSDLVGHNIDLVSHNFDLSHT